MLNILFITIALGLSSSDLVMITESKTAPIGYVKEIPYPHFVKIRSEKALPMELILISGSRKIWMDEGNTNRRIMLPLFNNVKNNQLKITSIVIKVKERERPHVYKIKVLPRIPADNSPVTQEQQR